MVVENDQQVDSSGGQHSPGAAAITREAIFNALSYSPTPAQREILDDTHSTQLVAGGYRGGKSRTASMKGLLATLEFISRYRDRAAVPVASTSTTT